MVRPLVLTALWLLCHENHDSTEYLASLIDDDDPNGGREDRFVTGGLD